MEDHVHSESCNHEHHAEPSSKETLAVSKAVDPRIARNRRKAAIRKAKNAASSKEERRAAAKGMSVEMLEIHRRTRGEQTPQRTRSAVREMKRRQKRAIRQMETRYRSEVRGRSQHHVILDDVQDIK